jgi:cysteine desulfurase/selenocysteine lyase
MEIKEKMQKARAEFPILSRKINTNPLIYMDNASTTQKPMQVINVISNFYKNTNANVHRAVYTLGEEATAEYDSARRTIAKFINASEKEVIFTKGTTESLNLLSYTLSSITDKNRKEIVLSELEHHSNIIPWQQLAKREGFKLKFIAVKDDLTLDYKDALNKITEKTAIVSITHRSNVFGLVCDVQKIISIAHSKGALVIIDSAQTAAHLSIDVRALDCDFMVFSAHKMFGPTGIGALYGKEKLLEKLPPFNFGGSMVDKVSYESASWTTIPIKFEAGTPDISGAIGFGEAVNYINKIGIENISKTEHELGRYALDKLSKVPGIKIYSPDGSSILSFNLNNVHPHDVASLLNDYGICIRAGHHCAMPLMQKIGISGTCRVSLAFYNTFEEIDKLAEALKKIVEMFSNG